MTTAKIIKIDIQEGTDLNNLIEQVQFPIDSFPLSVQNVINATSDSLQFPQAFIGCSLLYSASVSIGNTAQVKVKEGWTETALIYLANVGRPGTNKTHPLSWAIEPIIKNDSESFRQYKAAKAEFDSNSSLTKKERQELGIPDPVKPTWNKLLVSDVTPEALAEIHSNNLRGLGLYTDELAGWFKNFNRYHKGGEMEFWLSNWSNKPVIIDRKGGEPVFIHKPFISIAGTIQDGVLKDLAKDGRTQNGFIDRILFSAPQDLQKPYWSESNLDPTVSHSWKQIVDKLLQEPIYINDFNQVVSNVVTYAPEAYQALTDWQRRNTDDCNKEQDDTLSSIYAKLEIYCIRISLILHLLEWACNDGDKSQIQEHTVEAAIKLTEYFRTSARRVQHIMNSTPTDKLPDDKRELYAELPEQFTTEEGVLTAASLEIPERTLKRFIADKRFFKHVKRGLYEKRF